MEEKDKKKSFSDLALKKIPKGGNEENPKEVVNTLYEKDNAQLIWKICTSSKKKYWKKKP